MNFSSLKQSSMVTFYFFPTEGVDSGRQTWWTPNILKNEITQDNYPTVQHRHHQSPYVDVL